MLKPILSIIGGLIVAFALVFASDALFHLLTPSLMAPADTNDREAMRRYVAGQPMGSLVGVLVGWAVAVLAGSAAAARFGGRGASPGWVVAGLFLLATAANFLMVPHPIWMVIAGTAMIVTAGWFGSRLTASP